MSYPVRTVLAYGVVYIHPLWFLGGFFICLWISVLSYVSDPDSVLYGAMFIVFFFFIFVFQFSIPYLLATHLLGEETVYRSYYPQYLDLYYLLGIFSLLILFSVEAGGVVFQWESDEVSFLAGLAIIPSVICLIALARIPVRMLDILSNQFLHERYDFIGGFLLFLYSPVFLFLIQRRIRKLKLAGAQI